MDQSEEYVKMCVAATEIQALKPIHTQCTFSGSKINDKLFDYGDYLVLVSHGMILSKPLLKSQRGYEKKGCIWIPR